MNEPNPLAAAADKVEALFAKQKVVLTLGGEPTFVPIKPEGPEWHITALGPTKLQYGYKFAAALIADVLPQAVTFYSPGKSYPGETNPRWALNLLSNRDGTPLVRALRQPLPEGGATARKLTAFCKALLAGLKLRAVWLRGIDPFDEKRPVWVLPIDHDDRRFRSDDWALGKSLELIASEGPAGLRLPLNLVPEHLSRRALVVEIKDDALHVFLPPLLQKPFLQLVDQIVAALRIAQIGPVIFAGYVPSDEAKTWTHFGIVADPGVLEINLPPCFTWAEYDGWMHTLERAAAIAGLRSFKQISDEEALGTGGGNHLLFGGPTLKTNPLFTRPGWVTSMLRYWQHHPSLAYLFTGQYVGRSSQAPRPDESTAALYDLEMAYQFLEKLPAGGDHRIVLSETLRHLHTDSTGNTHRSEVSFDKFWNVAFDGGCRGLVEFRALETLPHARWMSALALLWRALAAHLLTKPFRKPLLDHGERLHDYFFLPSCLWADFESILKDLKSSGVALPKEIYREIFDWRFPAMLSHHQGDSLLTVRKGLEGWPLLCETPLEGGNTSRFVDTSIERLEFSASAEFARTSEVYVAGRKLPLHPLPNGVFGAGLRYRRSALYPSLHPGIPAQMPLHIVIKTGRERTVYRLEAWRRFFEPAPAAAAPRETKRPCTTLHNGLLTCDLRLP